MREVMYDQNSLLISGILFASMLIAIEAGYLLERRNEAHVIESSRTQSVQFRFLCIVKSITSFNQHVELK